MPRLRSARARALLAASVLLAMLAVVITVAAWSSKAATEARRDLAVHAEASTAVESTRAELFFLTTIVTAATLMEDPAFFLDQAASEWAKAQEMMTETREKLVAAADSDVVEAWDQAAKTIVETGNGLDPAMVTAAADRTSNEETARLGATLQTSAIQIVTELADIASRLQEEVVAQQKKADRTGDLSLIALIAAAVMSFIGASVALSLLTRSVLRPLASLQSSVRAIANGDVEAEAGVSGPTEVASLARDFNEMMAARRSAEAALREKAATDSLTGICNHRSLHEILAREVERSAASQRSVSVLMMDMDGFKLFNDTYGHQEGDKVLTQIAGVLKREMRPQDVVGRYGGDEFMAILPETERDEAVACANRILAAVGKEHVYTRQGRDLPLAISIGLAVCPEDSTYKEELIAYADASLMEAKQITGGNLVVAHQRADDESLINRRTPFGVLDALVRAVDRKDRYTRKHSQQNAELAVELGKMVGMSEGPVNALRIAGLLHDVGKIGVPDEILRKPGPLTDDEVAVMREHVTLGNLIVHGVPNLHDVSDAVLNHHERWDGEGYPGGLKGEEIPLPGRIMSLVDAYSAMILDRPYRKALSQEEAVNELRRCAGTQFDPSLVGPFIALIEGRAETAA